MISANARLLMMSSAYLFLILLLCSCTGTPERGGKPVGTRGGNPIGYNLSKADKTMILPQVLMEVSGIALIDSVSVACIQDEDGIIFVYDMKKNDIKNSFSFYSGGDYEGITFAGRRMYVLRSDGTIYQVSFDGITGSLTKIFSIGIPQADNECLCYDMNKEWLLVVPKNNPVKDAGKNSRHPVYGFDLNMEILTGNPAFGFDLKAIEIFAAGRGLFPSDAGGDTGDYFKPSDIAIHPVTGRIYVLSAVSRMLFVFNGNGKIEYIEKLDQRIFNMPEGIAFFPNGDMLISNEGQINPPTILRFNYRPT